MRSCLFIFMLIFSACSTSSKDPSGETSIITEHQNSEPIALPEQKKEAQKEKKSEEPLFIRLSDRNVQEYLTEFAKENKSSRVKIKTPQGDLIIKLYKDTPLHRASFIHLIQQHYFDNVEITRVEKNHVVQGGNSQKEAKATQRFLLGKYTIPSEFKSHHIHKKGALALAHRMENNPEKRSAPYDFYFVHGRKSGGAELYNIQKEKGITYSDSQKNTYKKLGGTPHLDRDFTVFGEIISGLSVLDKIAALDVDSSNWPKDDLIISMEILD